MTFAALETLGRAAAGKYPQFRTEALAVDPDQLATLIYTSGTTGDPKGVMLSHNNLWSNVRCSLQAMTVVPGDECLSMLPLSHVFERMVGYTMLDGGVIINYAESFEKVAANMQEVHPTIVLSVPRFFEKVYARVLENALAGSPVKRQIFFWAKRTGDAWATYRLAALAHPLRAGPQVRARRPARLLEAARPHRRPREIFRFRRRPSVGGDRKILLQCQASGGRRAMA